MLPTAQQTHKHTDIHTVSLASSAKTSVIINTHTQQRGQTDRQASSAKTSLIILHLAHAHTEKQEQRKGGGCRKGRERVIFQQRRCRWLDGSREGGKKKDEERKMKKKGLREEEERDKERDTR